MKLLIWYKYLFYKYYYWYSSGGKETNQNAEITALSIVIFLPFSTLLVSYLWICDFLNFDDNIKNETLYFICPLIFAIAYKLLCSKNKHIEIFNQFVSENHKEKIKGNIFVIAYSIFTFLYMMLVILLAPRNA